MSARRVLRAVGRLGREEGVSVVELTTTLALMLILGVATGTTLVSAMQATTALEEESAKIDDLRVSMSRLEREFRSAECVREPVSTSPGTSVVSSTLRFTTRSNGGDFEVTYAVTDGTLSRTEGLVTAEIVDGLVEPSNTFTYTETPRRSIDVSFVVEDDDGDRRHLNTTVAGRNAWRTC